MRFAALLALFALSTERSWSASPDSADLPITGNVLRYKGRTLRFFDRFEAWRAALGDPSGMKTNGANHYYSWDSAGLEVAAVNTPDGRDYVSSVKISLDRCRVSVFGSPLKPPVRYRDIQRALPDSATFEDDPGGQLRYGSLPLFTPDGFRVWLSADLRCDPDGPAPEPIRYRGHIPLPRKSKGDACRYIFDAIEITAAGDMGWK